MNIRGNLFLKNYFIRIQTNIFHKIMNKNYFNVLFYSALLIFCLFSGNANAQEQRIGFQVGGGLSDLATPKRAIEGASLEETLRSSSFGAAMILEQTFKKNKFGVSAEPGFIQRGYKAKNTPSLSNGIISLSNPPIAFYYTNLPISFFAQPFGNDRLRLSCGIETAYLFTTRVNGAPATPVVKDIFSKFDLLGFAGVQARVYNKLSLGVRVNRAFTPVVSVEYFNDQGESLGTSGWFNMNAQLYARYYFYHSTPKS